MPPAAVSAAEQAEPSPTWAAARAVFRALGSRRQVGAQFGGLVALLVVRSGLEAASIGALLALVPLLLPGSGAPSGWVTAMLGPGQAAGAWLSRIDLVLLAALALIVAKNLLLAAILVLRNKVAERWLVALSTRLFALGLDEAPEAAVHRDQARGSVLLNEMPVRVVNGVVLPGADLLGEVFVILALAGVLAVHTPKAALPLLLVLSIGSWLANRALVRTVRREGRMRLQRLGSMQRWVGDTLAVRREILLYGAKGAFVARYRHLVAVFGRAGSLERTVSEMQIPLAETIAMIGIVLVALAQSRSSDHLDPSLVSAMVACAAVGLRLAPSVRRIAGATQSLNFHSSAIGDLAAALAVADETMQASGQSREAAALPGTVVELQSVAYHHPGTPAPVLRDISLAIRPGEWLGLVGPSGAGKSTLVDLVLGYRLPAGGTIRLGRAPAGEARRAGIGYAGSDSLLLEGSLRENIVFGAGAGAGTSEAVLTALRLAGIDHLLQRFPSGLDTPMTFLQAQLSTGERQRIGIARAIHHSTDLLVLDEATGALDPWTEARLLTGLRRERPDLAVLLVLHRLASLRFVDRTLVLSAGRIVADARPGEPGWPDDGKMVEDTPLAR